MTDRSLFINQPTAFHLHWDKSNRHSLHFPGEIDLQVSTVVSGFRIHPSSVTFPSLPSVFHISLFIPVFPGILSKKLLALKSMSQDLLLGEPKPKQRSLHTFGLKTKNKVNEGQSIMLGWGMQDFSYLFMCFKTSKCQQNVMILLFMFICLIQYMLLRLPSIPLIKGDLNSSQSLLCTIVIYELFCKCGFLIPTLRNFDSVGIQIHYEQLCHKQTLQILMQTL